MRASLAIAAVTTIAVTLLLAFGIDDVLELPARDAALRVLPRRAAQHTIIVAIDEASIRELHAWPWSRDTLAGLVDRVADAGARGVVFDVLLSESREGDDRLARAMRRLPTITVAVLDDNRHWLLPTPVLRDASTPAHGNFEIGDGVLRQFASTKQSRDRSLIALPVEAASLVTNAPVVVGQSIAPAFRTSPRLVPQISAVQVLRDPNVASRLRGKVVFIGPTAFALSDRVLTPVTSRHLQDPGVTVHAAATESLIRGETIRELPPIVSGMIAGLLVWGRSSVGRRRPRRRNVVIPLSIAAFVIIATLVALNFGLAIPFVILLLTIAGVEAANMLASLRRSETQLQEIATRIAEVRAQEAESKRVLAHELKTPLASMRGLTQLLSGFDLNEMERKRVATLLATEAEKLEAMVHGLLDLERLPLRDFASSSSVVDLGEIVAARVEFLRASTDRDLTASIQPGLLVRADASLVERIVDNLAGNAMKYSPAKSPVAIRTAQIGSSAVLEVEDRGVGIAPEEREKIFRRFVRGSSAKGTQGLGLGLSLVAEVARWHGGSVSVDDASGGGALFRVTLPMAMEKQQWRASS